MGCLIIAFTILGFNAARKLGLELMPKTDLPYITVTTIYPGATPSEIETDIAKPIEDQVVTIEGLKHVSSSCMENVCMTLLEFNLGIDVDIAATDVREKLDLIRADLPADAEDPKILKFDINATAIMQLALTGDLPIDEIYDYADNTLRDRLSVIPGVADITLIGGAEREVHVILDRQKLAARGLTSTQVVQAVQQGIGTIPSGRVREKGMEYSVKFDADFADVQDIGGLEVANSNGQRCYIRDIGRVEMTTEELRQMADIDGRDCIAVKVVKKADANAVAVVDEVKKAIDIIRNELPGGMELIWVTDDGTFIGSTVSSAWINVVQGIILTALILFLFLYNFRSLLVVCITMPLTIIIGLFFVYFMGYTLNTPTLMSIGMSVGILVTNSIVILEAIVKRLEETGDPKSASKIGASEAAIAVLASAGTNVVVLFPIANMGSIIGLFMKPFAVTMIIMTAVSLFISFTLTPLLCSLILKPRKHGSYSVLDWMEQRWNRMFNRVVSFYGSSLRRLEGRKGAGIILLLVVFIILVHSLYIAGKLGSSMVTEPDKGEILVKMEYPTWYNLLRTREQVQKANERLMDMPHLKHRLSTIGKVEGMIGQSSEGVNLSQILLKFSERIERDLSIHELADMIRSRVASFPDAIVTVSIPSMVGGQSSGLEMEIAGQDFDTLNQLALRAKTLTEAMPGFIDVDTTVRTGKPELRIIPNRETLADLKSPAAGLGLALRANLEGIEAGTFKQNARNYDIVVKMEEIPGMNQVEQFVFPGTTGAPVLLGSLGEIQETISPVQITRVDKQRVSRLIANMAEGKALGTAVNEVTRALNEKGELPPGYDFAFKGKYEIMLEGQTEILEAALIALILVILTLSAIMESFRQPVVILVTVPLALIGIFYGLALGGKSIEIFALMGGVMLIGIVVNNAILIMDRFNVLLAEGVPRHNAMVQAACDRFRPIVMITLAAVLGMMPMAVGQGIGAEMRNACGLASVGGVLASGIFTMYVVPVIYNLFTRGNGSGENNSI